MCRVFVIDDDKSDNAIYQQLLEKVGFEVFATENAYKLVRYAQELHPQLYVVNSTLNGVNYLDIVEHLSSNHYLDNAPLVVLYDDNLQTYHRGISHYIRHQDTSITLPEVASAYCQGGQKYDLLLLDNTNDKTNRLPIRSLNVSFFNVYTPDAARLFLQKNNVEAVAVHCESSNYGNLKKILDFDETFYIENMANLNDLISFIK